MLPIHCFILDSTYTPINIDVNRWLDQYIAETRIERSGTWGTEFEIFMLAHLLKVNIFDYLPDRGWLRSTPRHVDRMLPHRNHGEVAIYIRLLHEHFEVVKSISQ